MGALPSGLTSDVDVALVEKASDRIAAARATWATQPPAGPNSLARHGPPAQVVTQGPTYSFTHKNSPATVR
jgi:hypothetical protein